MIRCIIMYDRLLTKEKAIEYRRSGDSYSMIVEKLGVTKSTLSDWLKNIPYSPNRESLNRRYFGPKKAAEIRHAQKVDLIKRIKQASSVELGNLSKRDLWMLGIGLYIGEGAKSIESVRLTNSDPDIINIGISWLKEICGLRTENLTMALHCYPDNDQDKTIDYWARATGIPKSRFTKTQVDERKNKLTTHIRKLPYGTVQLKVIASGNREHGVNLHRRIMGWIEAVTMQFNKRD